MNAPPSGKRLRPATVPENDEIFGGDSYEQTMIDEEEDLIALVEHRSEEVEHLRRSVSYYQTQVEEAEKRLSGTQQHLAHIRCENSVVTSQSQSEFTSQSGNQPHSKPKSGIVNIKQEGYQPNKATETVSRNTSSSSSSVGESSFCDSNSVIKHKGHETVRRFDEKDVVDAQDMGVKRIFDKKEQKDLVSMICSHSSPSMIRCETCATITSQHKRKLRSLVLCPTNDRLFATSALDGVVNLWQLQDRGSNAILLSSTTCLSAKQRRWPEDVAWHPDGNSLFSAYSADDGESQISILNLKKQKVVVIHDYLMNLQVSFMEKKPHVKEGINNIMFTPWEDNSFVTGGSDHAVVFWSEREQENSWEPKVLHRSVHSSAVMGVAGMQHKKIVLSAGADRRIIGFDLLAERVEYKHQIESKCTSVLPNPSDLNLFMVQTRTLEKQLRLFDIRARQTEVHSLRWKQECSEAQSALIQQAWSPNGLYISSGSIDPMIHIFDIRYNSNKPSQSTNAHKNRVFKAAWHPTLPLLISISSDFNIGLHKTA